MARNPNGHHFCQACNNPLARFDSAPELTAHMVAVHGPASLEGEGMERDPVQALEYLAQRTLDMIDELSDRTVTHATPEQAAHLLQALGQRCKILADRLDARAIRSRGFKL